MNGFLNWARREKERNNKKKMPAKNIELVFIPFPVLSHLVAAVKLAKILIDRSSEECLSITILILKLHTDTKIDSYAKKLPHSRIRFVLIPHHESTAVTELMKSPKNFMLQFMETQKVIVRDCVGKIFEDLKSNRVIAGFVLDMFCTAMMDVADEFGVPTYICYTCGAASLSLMFHFQSLSDDSGQDLTVFQDSDAEVLVPAYVNPFPARVLPSPALDLDFLKYVKRYRNSKGILINSFLELEPHAVKSLLDEEGIPRIYPVGPIIQADEEGEEKDEKTKARDEIINWLDKQPDSSVVYLCFGSNGCFESDQVKQIGIALEKSGYRFLWSLRKPPPEGKFEFAGEYENPEEVLPEGFLERTAGIGKVIGWAPQMAVLSHPSVGGFVSHCGWNSSLESVWCGVPIAAWPLYAEQQANAFQFVKDLGLAVEIKMDYKGNSNVIVGAEIIEKAIRELMDLENGIRVKVKVLQEKSRMVKLDGGSSHQFLGRLLQDFVHNIS